jgi:hypothetical protein
MISTCLLNLNGESSGKQGKLVQQEEEKKDNPKQEVDGKNVAAFDAVIK